MSDFAKQLDQSAILEYLFWDGVVSQAEIDQAAQTYRNWPAGTTWPMAADPRLARQPPQNIDVPHISGDPALGETLSVTMGNWTGEPSLYAYQWRRDGAAAGANSPTYLVTAADQGCDLDCVVTATNDYGATAAPPSNVLSVPAGVSR